MSAAERMAVAYLMTRLPAELVARAYGLTPRCAERVAASERRRREKGRPSDAGRVHC